LHDRGNDDPSRPRPPIHASWRRLVLVVHTSIPAQHSRINGMDKALHENLAAAETATARYVRTGGSRCVTATRS
jgi:hypothetical protein